MPLIPAFCNRCGAAFSSGIFIDNCVNISLYGNTSGPCPRCGGIGSVPNGVFNVINGVIEHFGAIRDQEEVLNRIANILTRAVEEKSSTQNIAKEIRYKAPEISNIAEVLPKTRTELYAFIALLLTLISILLANLGSNDDATEKLLNKILEKSMQSNYFIPYEETLISKPRRNSPCQCGSGKRFKQCCGISI